MEFEDDGNTVFFLDNEKVSCEKFNEYFNTHDVGWCDWLHDDGITKCFQIFRDERG